MAVRLPEQVGVWLVPGIFAAGLLAVVGLWLTGESVPTMQQGGSGVLIALGGLIGLVAYYLVLWQLLLMGRVGWIEPVYGHDRLSRVHHWNGLLVWALIGLHPVLLVLGYGWLNERGVVEQVVTFWGGYPNVPLAVIAYVMYLSIVFVSLTIVRRRLNYEWWYAVHFLLYGAIVLAFWHQVAVGIDLLTPGRVMFWWFLAIFVAANVLFYRFWLPVWRSWRHGYRVNRVVDEGGGVTSIEIGGRALEQLEARAGQFMIVRFLAWPWWREAHPFSLSEAPKGNRLRMSAKALGDFTRTLGRVPVGVRVMVDGPHGRFTSDRARPEAAVLLIAGGIGITPLRALFEEMTRAGRRVDLVYAARTPTDLVLRDELDALAAERSRVHYVPEAEQGRLTPELLRQLVPDLAGRDAFVCGPPSMMRAVREQLKGLGVPDGHIYDERFQLG